MGGEEVTKALKAIFLYFYQGTVLLSLCEVIPTADVKKESLLFVFLRLVLRQKNLRKYVPPKLVSSHMAQKLELTI